MSKFKVTPLQQGRHIAIDGRDRGLDLDVVLTRSEAIELTGALTAALKASAPLEIPEAGA